MDQVKTKKGQDNIGIKTIFFCFFFFVFLFCGIEKVKGNKEMDKLSCFESKRYHYKIKRE
jgi:hypothetical protein